MVNGGWYLFFLFSWRWLWFKEPPSRRLKFLLPTSEHVISHKERCVTCPFDVWKLNFLIRRVFFLQPLQFCGMYALLFAKIHSSKLLLQCFCCLDACRKLESALPGEPKKATRSRAVSVTEAIPGLVPIRQAKRFLGTCNSPGHSLARYVPLSMTEC